MTLDLYWRCLIYDEKRGGVAKEGPLKLMLNAPPPIFPHAVELDIREIHRGEFAFDPIIRDRDCDTRRDPTPPEVIAFRAYMSGLLTSLMRAAKRPPTVKKERRKGTP